MSNTTRHKEKAKYNNGLIEDVSLSTRLSWDRHNFDRGYFRDLHNRIKNKVNLKAENIKAVKSLIGKPLIDVYSEACSLERLTEEQYELIDEFDNEWQNERRAKL
jgi:hypothetical protein